MTEIDDTLDEISDNTIHLISTLEGHAERLLMYVDSNNTKYREEKDSYFKERDLTYEQIDRLYEIIVILHEIEGIEKEIDRLP